MDVVLIAFETVTSHETVDLQTGISVARESITLQSVKYDSIPENSLIYQTPLNSILMHQLIHQAQPPALSVPQKEGPYFCKLLGLLSTIQ